MSENASVAPHACGGARWGSDVSGLRGGESKLVCAQRLRARRAYDRVMGASCAEPSKSQPPARPARPPPGGDRGGEIVRFTGADPLAVVRSGVRSAEASPSVHPTSPPCRRGSTPTRPHRQLHRVGRAAAASLQKIGARSAVRYSPSRKRAAYAECGRSRNLHDRRHPEDAVENGHQSVEVIDLLVPV
jgi:hypothetical protein